MKCSRQIATGSRRLSSAIATDVNPVLTRKYVAVIAPSGSSTRPSTPGAANNGSSPDAAKNSVPAHQIDKGRLPKLKNAIAGVYRRRRERMSASTPSVTAAGAGPKSNTQVKAKISETDKRA
jgi:hypothetical protein